VVEVLLQEDPQARTVAARQRLEDLAVLADRLVPPRARDVGHEPRGANAAAQTVVHAGQDAVVGGGDDRLVNRLIGGEVAGTIAARVLDSALNGQTPRARYP